ncbi:MAG: hypothetical protein RJB01_1011 [Actinomycetota bacterium]|jgi:hypothetical protein
MTNKRVLIAAGIGFAVTIVLWLIVASGETTIDADGFIIEPVARMPYTALMITSGFTLVMSSALALIAAARWTWRRASHK